MGNEIVTKQERLTDVEIRAQVNLIQKVMKAVMKEDVHYGVIPGCNKPSLYKPGSEIILSTFKLACEPIVEDLSSSDEARFRVTARLTHGNLFVGAGIGECSSNEKKYKWRKPVCKEEFDDTPEDRKRETWKAGFRGAPSKKSRQVRTDIADVANTILKMAKKRAQIDATLTATAASDIFTQDIEDIPSELLNEAPVNKKPDVQAPQAKSELTIDEMAKKVFKTKKDYGLWLKDKFKVAKSKDLSAEQEVSAAKALTELL